MITYHLISAALSQCWNKVIVIVIVNDEYYYGKFMNKICSSLPSLICQSTVARMTEK